MEDRYIKLDDLEMGDLKKKISKDFKIPHTELKDEFLEFVENFIETRATEEEYIEKETKMPTFPRDQIGMTIDFGPRTYYHINVKRTTWFLLGLILTIILTKELAPSLLYIFVGIGVTTAKLSPINGEICIYFQAHLLKKSKMRKFEEKDIFNRIAKRKCLDRRLGCMYCKKEKCSIRLSCVKNIFVSLKEKGALIKTQDNKWRVPL